MIQTSFNFRFSSRKSQSQQKLVKNIANFTIQIHSKNLTYFTNLNSLKIVKSKIPQHSHSLYKFSSTHVSDWYQKKHLNCTISRCPRIVFSKHWESFIFPYISVNNILLQRCRKLLSGGWLNNFLKSASCLRFVKFLKFFILIEIFENLTIYQHFDTSINNIKTLKF